MSRARQKIRRTIRKSIRPKVINIKKTKSETRKLYRAFKKFYKRQGPIHF